MCNINTKSIVHTRDVTWFGNCYKSITKTPSKNNDDDNDDNENFIHKVAALNQEANNVERMKSPQIRIRG
jgi:hypothetical protein